MELAQLTQNIRTSAKLKQSRDSQECIDCAKFMPVYTSNIGRVECNSNNR